ncbi:hypothetical protein V8C34DRAFT_313189 [Trichoderma compactum]
MAAFAHACAVGSRPTASSWWCGEQPCGWTALMGCLLHKLVCSVSYAGAEHLVLYLYRCCDADLGASIGNKLHSMPKVSKVCLRCVYSYCCHAWVLPLPKEVTSTCCQARPWLQTYPCCKPCRAHGLDTLRSTCRRKLAGNRNHFSTMDPTVGCRS